MTQHPYCYPGTNVYRNKHGIRDATDLENLERDLSGFRLLRLPQKQPITPKAYRRIHHYLFQDIYDWAGKDRWIDTGRGAPFCKAAYIVAELDRRFAAIAAENDLRGLDARRFAERAAEHLNELNAIHPFLDGNGRTQRAFLEILAKQAGHEIDLARVDAQAWNQASIRGFHRQDHAQMSAVIAGAIPGV